MEMGKWGQNGEMGTFWFSPMNQNVPFCPFFPQPPILIRAIRVIRGSSALDLRPTNSPLLPSLPSVPSARFVQFV